MLHSWIPRLRSWFFPQPLSPSPHNLQELFQEVNTTYFGSSLDLTIRWYGKGTTKARTGIRLGYYNPKTQHIAINRLLNTSRTPKYFLSYIIYHEILHHILPPLLGSSGRRKIHHRQFLEKEKEFVEYEQAQLFLSSLKKNHLR